ncbi:MAG: glycoside hydrolase family 3 C-terminal domain-containing protein, partial [Bacteroidales bacterium]|nr:glycoside hydrolase family 3 C-terminal domain-containing protein [Bacteroidales bacterium]
LGVEMVLGMQKDYQVAATGKHFAIYSNNKGGREGMARVDPQTSPHEVENIHMVPWKEVIGRAGMLGVMSSYNDYDGTPVQGSPYWLTERLRNDFGFKGYVVSDSDAVEYLHSKHKVSRDMKESVRQAVEAGLNVRCTFRTPDSYVLPLRQLISEGTLPIEMINDRVRDILRVKFLVGLFDQPYQLDYRAADLEVNCEENNRIALQASRESLVLLKNDGMLPLDASKLKKVAVIGPNADETSFVHTHYGPLATDAVSVLDGLRKALEGKAEVEYEKGCELVDAAWPESELIPTDPDAAELAAIEKAVSLARRSDAVILVLGGGQRTCGENKSRSSLDLPGRQDLLLKEVMAAGTPVTVVLIGGRPMSINRAKRDANAILEAWYPGSHGGTAIAEVLLGKYNPGGKLSVTFPKSVGQIPFNFPFKPNSQVDGGNKPGLQGNQSRVNGALWDFGFGLSYTTFEYSNLSLSSRVIAPDGQVSVSFDVTNTGAMAGDEIVQLYIHDCLSSITVYERQLRGFERVHLEPGQTKTINMTLGPEAFSLLDANMNRVVECGDFDILIGASSTDIRLQTKMRICDGSEPDATNLYPDDASTRGASFPASLNISEDVTLPLKEGKLINDLAVEWGKGTDCEFEILFTNGGGQFLPLYKGKAKGESSGKYEFEATEASEIRISITRGHAVVKEMDSYAILKQ